MADFDAQREVYGNKTGRQDIRLTNILEIVGNLLIFMLSKIGKNAKCQITLSSGAKAELNIQYAENASVTCWCSGRPGKGKQCFAFDARTSRHGGLVPFCAAERRATGAGKSGRDV